MYWGKKIIILFILLIKLGGRDSWENLVKVIRLSYHRKLKGTFLIIIISAYYKKYSA
jgi:hypothetical protein